MIDFTTACIVVGNNGFAWYAPQVRDEGSHLYLTNARIIRDWGTTKGLAELVTGPTPSTVLDCASDVVLAPAAFIFAIPCKTWNI